MSDTLESNLSHYFTPIDNPKTAEYYNLAAAYVEMQILATITLLSLSFFQWDTWVNDQGHHFAETGVLIFLYLLSSQRRTHLKEKLDCIEGEDSLLWRETSAPAFPLGELNWPGYVAFHLDKLRSKTWTPEHIIN